MGISREAGSNPAGGIGQWIIWYLCRFSSEPKPISPSVKANRNTLGVYNQK